MEFVVIGRDGTDGEAPARRQAARAAHLEGAKKLKEQGHWVSGGAILNDAGEMIGSVITVAFDSREALDQWVQNDAYVSGGVWKEIEILPVKLILKD